MATLTVGGEQIPEIPNPLDPAPASATSAATTFPAMPPLIQQDASGAKTTPSGGFAVPPPTSTAAVEGGIGEGKASEQLAAREGGASSSDPDLTDAMKAHAQLIYRARLAEQVERYDEMSAYMKEAALSGIPLRVEERNLLSVAYKNSVGERRAAWRIMSAIEAKQHEKGEEKLEALATQYRLVIEKELSNICNEVLDLLENRLLKDVSPSTKGGPGASASAEARVFYCKMQGDYFRYIAEYLRPEQRENPKSRAENAYRMGLVAAEELQPVNPIRLGLILNFSVFYYEIMNDPEEACRLAHDAFDEAVTGLDTASENTYRDAALIIQLLRDNLTLWSQEASKGVDPADGGATAAAAAVAAPQASGATSHREAKASDSKEGGSVPAESEEPK